MLHYFDTETACAYGVTEAILLNHFAYWIARNREAGRNFREGRTWMDGSGEASELQWLAAGFDTDYYILLDIE